MTIVSVCVNWSGPAFATGPDDPPNVVDVVEVEMVTVVVVNVVVVMAPNVAAPAKTGPATPQLEATMVLDTKQMREQLADKSAPAPGGGPLGISRPAWMSEPFVAAKDRIGLLSILEGKTDQEKYVLTSKMTMIGKSSMASIRLKGFFAPTTAALISKRDNKYFIAPSESKTKLKINGEDVVTQRELAPGDIIEVGKVKATFSFQD